MVAFAGLALRAWILLTPTGVLNSDEAVTGLSAMNVARGRFDLLIPDSYYTVIVESYLFSPVVKVFGGRIVLLKLMPIVLWFVASVLGAGIARRLTGERAALAAFAGLWLIPGAMLVISTRAYLAYAGGLVVVLGAMWTMLVVVGDGPLRWRSALAGVLTGLAFMQHPIYLCVLGPAAVVVTAAHRRAWREWHVPAAVGFLVGCGPWLVWNVLHDFASLHETDADPSTYTGRVSGYFRHVIPRDFGLIDPAGRWILGRPLGIFVYAVLVAVAVFAVVRLIQSGPGGRLVAIPAVAGWFALGVFQHTSFVVDGRYGIAAFPLVVICLATLLGGSSSTSLGTLGRVAVAAGWVGLLLVPYQVHTIGTRLGDPNAANAALVRALDEHGITHLKGSYWIVLPVSYATDERIASAVFYPWPVRYPHLQQRVDAASPDAVAVAFEAGSFNKDLLVMPADRYRRLDLPGIELYIPMASS